MWFCPPCPNFIASMAAYPLLSFSFKVSKYAFICFSISSEYFMRSIKFESFITCDSFQLALDIGTVIREIIYLLSLNNSKITAGGPCIPHPLGWGGRPQFDFLIHCSYTQRTFDPISRFCHL